MRLGEKRKRQTYVLKKIKSEGKRSRSEIKRSLNLQEDEDLNEYLIQNGTFKDKVTTLALHVAKGVERAAGYKAVEQEMKELLRYAEGSNSNAAIFALSSVVDLLVHSIGAKVEGEEFVHVRKRLLEILRDKLSSEFIKRRVLVLIKKLMEANLLPVQTFSLLTEFARDKTLFATIGTLISAVYEKSAPEERDRIALNLVSQFKSGGRGASASAAVNTLRLLNTLFFSKKMAEEVFSAIVKRLDAMLRTKKEGGRKVFKFCSDVFEERNYKLIFEMVKGINRVLSSLPEDSIESLVEYQSFLFKAVYLNSFRISYETLLLLFKMRNKKAGLEKSYVRTLYDYIWKYKYHGIADAQKSRVLNLVLETVGEDGDLNRNRAVLKRVVKHGYCVDLQGRYAEGVLMVASEMFREKKELRALFLQREHGTREEEPLDPAVLKSKTFFEVHLLKRSYDRNVCEAAETLLSGQYVKVHDVFAEEDDGLSAVLNCTV